MPQKTENTSDRIINAAINHFSIYGYSGASMSAIADEVDIRKSTIYSHFISKEELFYACMKTATEKTFEQIDALLKEMGDRCIQETLYAFLTRYDDFGINNPTAVFHERFAYFPPEEIKEEVMRHSNNTIQQIRDKLLPIFQSWAAAHNIQDEMTDELLTTFICLYDGLMVERLIGNKEKFDYRLKHTWSFFAKALRLTGQSVFI